MAWMLPVMDVLNRQMLRRAQGCDKNGGIIASGGALRRAGRARRLSCCGPTLPRRPKLRSPGAHLPLQLVDDLLFRHLVARLSGQVQKVGGAARQADVGVPRLAD